LIVVCDAAVDGNLVVHFGLEAVGAKETEYGPTGKAVAMKEPSSLVDAVTSRLVG